MFQSFKSVNVTNKNTHSFFQGTNNLIFKVLKAYQVFGGSQSGTVRLRLIDLLLRLCLYRLVYLLLLSFMYFKKGPSRNGH